MTALVLMYYLFSNVRQIDSARPVNHRAASPTLGIPNISVICTMKELHT